jgi:2-oxoglutarate ferredoxin oxidoreductase subunit alpha
VDVDSAYLDDAETVVLAYGSVARSALSATKMARAEGLKVGFIKLKIIWPFPDQFIKDAIRNVHTIIVPEMNIGRIVREIERLTHDGQQIRSASKLGGNIHTPQEILAEIKN